MEDITYLDVPRVVHPKPRLGQEQSSKSMRNFEFEDLAQKLLKMGFEVEFGPIFGGFPSEGQSQDNYEKMQIEDGYRFILRGEKPTNQILIDLAPEGSRLYVGGLKSIEK